MLRPAKKEDINILTKISKDSFDSDVEYGSQGCGPSGFDSVDWHLNKINSNTLFVFEMENKIVGGAVLNCENEKVYIHRLFIDPNNFRKGFGTELMKEIEDYFSDSKRFILDTPEWNKRTNLFYQSCGYEIVGRVDNTTFMLNIYEKQK